MTLMTSKNIDIQAAKLYSEVSLWFWGRGGRSRRMEPASGSKHANQSAAAPVAACWMTGMQAWLAGSLVGWLACWLAGLLAGWLASWLTRLNLLKKQFKLVHEQSQNAFPANSFVAFDVVSHERNT